MWLLVPLQTVTLNLSVAGASAVVDVELSLAPALAGSLNLSAARVFFVVDVSVLLVPSSAGTRNRSAVGESSDVRDDVGGGGCAARNHNAKLPSAVGAVAPCVSGPAYGATVAKNWESASVIMVAGASTRARATTLAPGRGRCEASKTWTLLHGCVSISSASRNVMSTYHASGIVSLFSVWRTMA